MPAVSCCFYGALLPGAEPFPRCPRRWSFFYRSQSSHGNGIPSYLVGPIQHSSAHYVVADFYSEIQAGFYQRDALHSLGIQ